MKVFVRAVGRRKEAIAQVQIVRGTGQFIINEKPVQQYLQNDSLAILMVKSPLTAIREELKNLTSGLKITELKITEEQSNGNLNQFLPGLQFDEIDILVLVKGGGLMGQAQAIKLGVSRAIYKILEIKKQIKSKNTSSSSKKAKTVKASAARTTRKKIGHKMTLFSVSSLIQVVLKKKGYLTQDSRVIERKKYGLRKARKAPQYHKR